MSYCVFLIAASACLISALSTAVAAFEPAYENPSALQTGAQTYLAEQLETRFGQQKMQTDVEFKLLPIDAHLRLAKCSEAVIFSLNRASLGAGQASVKIACSGAPAWAVTLLAQITLYGQVAVAKRSLARGDLLQPSDIQFERQNLAQIGPNYVDTLERLAGVELKRPLREGEILRMSYFAAPKIVHTGDQVSLEADAGGLSIVTSGIALGDGQLGEAIRIKNSSSQRIIDAMVIAPGRVRVR